MPWIVITSALSALASIYFGYLKIIHFQNLNRKSLTYFLLLATVIITILRVLHLIGLFPENIAGATMTAFYSSVSGFLFGGGISNYIKKREFGKTLYRNRNFTTDILPVILGISLLLMGVYRMSIFSDVAVTPIRLSSGLSILMLGIWVLTIQAVPEFRDNGFILIDRFIPWSDLVSYEWYDEQTIRLEYKLNEEIQLFGTKIPAEDQLELEKLLNQKIIEFSNINSVS